MEWQDEKDKLVFSHELEIKRIKLNHKLKFYLSLFLALLAGMGAYILAPQYASELKKQELLESKNLQLTIELEKSFVQPRIEAYIAVDSCFAKLCGTFVGAAWHIENNEDQQSLKKSVHAVLEDANNCLDVLISKKLFLDTAYVSHAASFAMLYESLIYVNTERWNELRLFFLDLHSQLVILSRGGLRSVIEIKATKLFSDETFRLSPVELPPTKSPATSQFALDYVLQEYNSWKEWRLKQDKSSVLK